MAFITPFPAWPSTGSPDTFAADVDTFIAHLTGTFVGELEALLDAGSNGNGYWLRFGDGTQLCHHVDTTSLPTTTAAGPIYQSVAATWTYPAAFLSTPLSGAATPNTDERWGTCNPGLTSMSFRQWRHASNVSTPMTNLLAIGRWK